METAGYEKNRMYIGGSQSFIFRIFVSTWLDTFASWSLQDRDSIILEKEGYAVPALFPHNSEVVIIFGSPLDSEGIFLPLCLVWNCSDSWGSSRLFWFHSGCICHLLVRWLRWSQLWASLTHSCTLKNGLGNEELCNK